MLFSTCSSGFALATRRAMTVRRMHWRAKENSGSLCSATSVRELKERERWTFEATSGAIEEIAIFKIGNNWTDIAMMRLPFDFLSFKAFRMEIFWLPKKTDYSSHFSNFKLS